MNLKTLKMNKEFNLSKLSGRVGVKNPFLNPRNNLWKIFLFKLFIYKKIKKNKIYY